MLENDSRKIIDKTRNDYNLIAKEWDLSRMRPSQVKLNLLGKVEADTEVLDVGCGNAMMLPYVVQKGAYYAGVDISENLIAIAGERYAGDIEAGRARLMVGEATDLPFKDEEFDLIISFAVLHHIPSEELRRRFFEEIHRTLRPGGKVKITVWNLFNDWAKERFEVGSQLSGKTSGDVSIPWKGTRGETVNRYVHQFSQEELYALAHAAGFNDIEIGCYGRNGEKKENGEEMVLEIEG